MTQTVTAVHDHVASVLTVLKFKKLAQPAGFTELFQEWARLLVEVDNVMAFLTTKPCAIPENQQASVAALQQCVLILDGAEGASKIRGHALATARLLICGKSLVAPVKRLPERARQMTAKSKAQLERCRLEIRKLFDDYQQQTGLQHNKVASLQRILGNLQEHVDAAYHKEMTPSHLEAQHALLIRLNTQRPELDRQMLALEQLEKKCNVLRDVARCSESTLADRTFEAMAQDEQKAAKVVASLAQVHESRLRALTAQAAKGESARMRKTLDECLTHAARSCAFRDNRFSNFCNIFQQVQTNTARNLTTLLGVISEYCKSTERGLFMKSQLELLQLDIPAQLKQFFALRANGIIAFHLFTRVENLNTWLITDESHEQDTSYPVVTN